jgi:hypothetical protein
VKPGRSIEGARTPEEKVIISIAIAGYPPNSFRPPAENMQLHTTEKLNNHEKQCSIIELR